MSTDSPVNWPLFLFTSLVICLRSFAAPLCVWFLNKYYSPSSVIDKLTAELKVITNELGQISQQDQFAAYTRKERQRNALVQRLKDERNVIELKQKNFVTYIRMVLNIGTVLMMIILTVTGYRHETVPLFNYPFFRFPLILWILTLNTFVTSLVDIYKRHQTNIL
ncbi:unnamed protein product [Adineta ricciae]|uniref:Guided entry of tail-anchored proteins factor 1 n=1 Tax=Adineta ricciae TaxID=249248 RepID=A0A815YGR5_ADIRI|nr:unnamed protein product [Adineta ricciae]CAF1570652.1 unnamed protein product [Adineta ricciae]